MVESPTSKSASEIELTIVAAARPGVRERLRASSKLYLRSRPWGPRITMRSGIIEGDGPSSPAIPTLRSATSVPHVFVAEPTLVEICWLAKTVWMVAAVIGSWTRPRA